MLRQCFFPSSYKRRSSNSIKPQNNHEKEQNNQCSFVRRLDLSCRRPAHSERHMKSSHQSQCLTQGQEEIQQAKKQTQLFWKSIYSRKKSHQTKSDKNKFILDFSKKEDTNNKETKETKRKSSHMLNIGISKRVGISEIKNQDFNWRPLQKQRINMTERVKAKQRKQAENIIIGWDFYEDTDPVF